MGSNAERKAEPYKKKTVLKSWMSPMDGIHAVLSDRRVRSSAARGSLNRFQKALCAIACVIEVIAIDIVIAIVRSSSGASRHRIVLWVHVP